MSSESKTKQNSLMDLSNKFTGKLASLAVELKEDKLRDSTKVLMITSSKSGEGKTLAAITIAKSLAEDDDTKVLLIDANFKSPLLHHEFEVNKSPGLSEMIKTDAKQINTCVKSKINNLDILPCGNIDKHTAGTINSKKFEACLNNLKKYYDYIITDTSAFLETQEPGLICHLFDSVLLVVECESTKWQVSKTAADQITKAGGNLIGTIINRRKFYIPRFFYG